jgi:predicted kinase
MNTLIVTVGLPRSGKSTWAKGTGHPIVNPDAIRLAIHYPPAEPLVWGLAHTMVDALFMAGHETVVIDATNVTEKRRTEWQLPGVAVKFEIFSTLPSECIRRAKANGREDLVPVIQRMARQWDLPVLPVDPSTWFEGVP